MTTNYLFILLAWIGGFICGCLIAQYHRNKLKTSRKIQASALKGGRQAYQFAQDFMDMVEAGKFSGLSHNEFFEKYSTMVTSRDIYRKLYERDDLEDKKPSQISEFRDRSFNIHLDIESYEILYKGQLKVDIYSYHYYGSSLYIKLWQQTIRKKKGSGFIKDYKAYKKSFIHRIFEGVPCYLFKFRIYRNGKPEVLFMNVIDVPVDGFRVAAFICMSEYRKYFVSKI